MYTSKLACTPPTKSHKYHEKCFCSSEFKEISPVFKKRASSTTRNKDPKLPLPLTTPSKREPRTSTKSTPLIIKRSSSCANSKRSMIPVPIKQPTQLHELPKSDIQSMVQNIKVDNGKLFIEVTKEMLIKLIQSQF